MWAQVINIVIGLLVMAAPAIWDFDKVSSNNNHIAGPLIVTFAITALWEVNRNVRWLNIVAGTWLMMSPLILGMKTPALEINLLLGIGVVLFSLFKGRITRRYGGGWRSLLQKHPLHMQDDQA